MAAALTTVSIKEQALRDANVAVYSSMDAPSFAAALLSRAAAQRDMDRAYAKLEFTRAMSAAVKAAQAAAGRAYAMLQEVVADLANARENGTLARLRQKVVDAISAEKLVNTTQALEYRLLLKARQVADAARKAKDAVLDSFEANAVQDARVAWQKAQSQLTVFKQVVSGRSGDGSSACQPTPLVNWPARMLCRRGYANHRHGQQRPAHSPHRPS